MGYPDRIRYEFGALDEGIAALRQAAHNAELELQDLRTKLASALEVWEGQGDQTYVEVKQRWDSAAAELHLIASDMTTRVSNVNTNMRDTEDTVVKLLRSHHV